MIRDPRLRRLSVDHHHALALALRARDAGAEDAAAVWAAVRAAFAQELEPHFRVEEAHLLPALAAHGEDGLVHRTESDHAALRAAVAEGAPDGAAALRAFGEALQAHVKFEERELFETAQATLSDAELEAVARAAEAQPAPRVEPPKHG